MRKFAILGDTKKRRPFDLRFCFENCRSRLLLDRLAAECADEGFEVLA